MKSYGIQLEEGSEVKNLTVDSGTAFPITPNKAELFYRTDTDPTILGLYVFNSAGWDRIITSATIEPTEIYDATFTATVTSVTTIIHLNGNYSPNTTRVWVGGLRQKRNIDYIESSSNEITLNFVVTDADQAAGINIVVDYVGA